MKSGIYKLFNINRFAAVCILLTGMAFGQSPVDSIELYNPFEQSDAVRRIIKGEFSVIGREYADALIRYSEEIHRAAEDDFNTRAEANSKIGDIYFRFSDYTKALQYYFQALKLYDNAGDSLSAAFIKLKLGRA